MLYELLISLGGFVDFGKAVMEIIPYDLSSGEATGPQIMLDGGGIIAADVVVAADGPASATRTAIANSGLSAHDVGTVPREYVYRSVNLTRLFLLAF